VIDPSVPPSGASLAAEGLPQAPQALRFPTRMPAGSPNLVAADRFSLNGSGEISGISLIPESEMHLWTTGIPHQRRCIVADRFLLIHKAFEQGLRRCQFIPADKFV